MFYLSIIHKLIVTYRDKVFIEFKATTSTRIFFALYFLTIMKFVTSFEKGTLRMIFAWCKHAHTIPENIKSSKIESISFVLSNQRDI